jgi:hypothetical protein
MVKTALVKKELFTTGCSYCHLIYFLRFQFAFITFIALILKETTFDILNLNKRK